jgi:hypothetical protein
VADGENIVGISETRSPPSAAEVKTDLLSKESEMQRLTAGPETETEIQGSTELLITPMTWRMLTSLAEIGVAQKEIRLANGRRVKVFEAEDQDHDVWDPTAVRLSDSIIEVWRLIREAQLIDFDEERTTGPKPVHYERIYEELQLEVELLSLSTGRDLPNEILRWISFKHRGPPPRRKSFPQLPGAKPHDATQEPIKSSDVESTRQGPEHQHSGPRTGNFPPSAQRPPTSRSCQSFASYRTVEDRIQIRKQRGRYLFKRQWKQISTSGPPEIRILILSHLGIDGIVSCEPAPSTDSQVPFSDDEWMFEARHQSLVQLPTRCESDPDPEPLSLEDGPGSPVLRTEIAPRAIESQADDMDDTNDASFQKFTEELIVHEVSPSLSASRADESVFRGVLTSVSLCRIPIQKGDCSSPEVRSEHSPDDLSSSVIQESLQSDSE